MPQRVTKFQLELKDILATVEPADLEAAKRLGAVRTLLEKISPADVEPSVAARSATEADVQNILDLNTNAVADGSWDLASTVCTFELSAWFHHSYKKWKEAWKATCEKSTRTFIDLVLLEVAHKNVETYHGNPLICCGETSLRYTNSSTGRTPTGFGDYFIAYSVISHPRPEQVLIVGEAKAEGEKLLPWQLVSYMGIVHRARIDAKKDPRTVYGFLTDSMVWRFYRIDDDSNVWASPLYDFRDPRNRPVIFGALAHLIRCAQEATPSCTKSPSVSDLDVNMMRYTFPMYTERFAIITDMEGGEALEAVSGDWD